MTIWFSVRQTKTLRGLRLLIHRSSTAKKEHGLKTRATRIRTESESLLRRGCFSGPRFLRSLNRGLAFRVGGHPHLHVCPQIFGELDLHRVLLDAIQLAWQVDVVRLHIEALSLQRLGDVGGADRAKQMAILVGAAFKRDFHALKLLEERRLLLAAIALHLFDFLAAFFHLLDVAGRGLNGKIIRDEIISGVPRRDIDDIADTTDVLDGFFEEEFDGCHGLTFRISNFKVAISNA